MPDRPVPEGTRGTAHDPVERVWGRGRPGGTVEPVGLPVQITFDCHDADLLAEFWALALDYQYEPPPAGFESWEAALEANGIPLPEPGSIGAVVDPDGVGPRLLFLRVPEGKTVKNRLHLDIRAGGEDERLAKVRQLPGDDVDPNASIVTKNVNRAVEKIARDDPLQNSTVRVPPQQHLELPDGTVELIVNCAGAGQWRFAEIQRNH